jgi:hypothetical protein
VKAGQEPVTCVCRVGVLGGGDTGERGPATAPRSSTPAPGGVGRNDGVVRLVRVMSTLLGPERTTGGWEQPVVVFHGSVFQA